MGQEMRDIKDERNGLNDLNKKLLEENETLRLKVKANEMGLVTEAHEAECKWLNDPILLDVNCEDDTIPS